MPGRTLGRPMPSVSDARSIFVLPSGHLPPARKISFSENRFSGGRNRSTGRSIPRWVMWKESRKQNRGLLLRWIPRSLCQLVNLPWSEANFCFGFLIPPAGLSTRRSVSRKRLSLSHAASTKLRAVMHRPHQKAITFGSPPEGISLSVSVGRVEARVETATSKANSRLPQAWGVSPSRRELDRMGSIHFISDPAIPHAGAAHREKPFSGLSAHQASHNSEIKSRYARP